MVQHSNNMGCIIAQVTQNLKHAPLESARVRECFEVCCFKLAVVAHA